MAEVGLIRSTAALLSYDEQTALPRAGIAYRADQLAYFGKLAHERFTSPQIGEWLGTIEASDLIADPESDVAANVRELRRSYDRATRLPADLVEAMAKHDTLAQNAWVEARKTSDFRAFSPWLAQTYAFKRQEADHVGYAESPYDALLDDYEPHETASTVRPVLEGLRDELIGLVQRVAGSSKRAPTLPGPFPVAAQTALGQFAARSIGFDFEAGRLDVSVHPFCSGMAPGDTRMTTRYREDEFDGSLFGVLHETGHALYEQGLPKSGQEGLPIASAVSLGIHESQSRMWENLVGRSEAFWRWFGPHAREHLPTLRGVSDADLLFAVNDVRPSFIRTEADEVTYNLHVLLRFELEYGLLNGQLAIDDVPDAWQSKMQTYLGITPPDAARGCLQDVHWSAGLIGYFATYTLGNLYSAQFFEQARQDLGDLDAQFARGDFVPLLTWLRQHIHRHGKRYTAAQLVERVTGRPLSPTPLVNYLRGKVDRFYA